MGKDRGLKNARQMADKMETESGGREEPMDGSKPPEIVFGGRRRRLACTLNLLHGCWPCLEQADFRYRLPHRRELVAVAYSSVTRTARTSARPVARLCAVSNENTTAHLSDPDVDMESGHMA